MGKRRGPPPLLLAVAVLVLSLAAASEAAARRKSSRKLSSGNDLGGEDGVAAEDLIPIPDHYLLSDDQAATEHEDDFDDYEYDDAEDVGEEDDRVGKKRESSSFAIELKDPLIRCRLEIEPPSSLHELEHTFLSVKRVFSGKQVFLRDEPLLSRSRCRSRRHASRNAESLVQLRGEGEREGMGSRVCVRCGCLS